MLSFMQPLHCSPPMAQSWAQLCWGGHRALVPFLVALCYPWGTEKWVGAGSNMVKSPFSWVVQGCPLTCPP